MMTKIKSFDELKSVQERLKAGRDPKKPCITICVGTGCLAYGTQKLVDNFREELAKRNLADKIDFRTTGCHGFCERGPMVVIAPEKIFYQRVGLADAGEIIDKTVLKGEIIDRLLYVDPATGEKVVHEDDVPFYKKQTRLVFGHEQQGRSGEPGGLPRHRRLQRPGQGPDRDEAGSDHPGGDQGEPPGPRRRRIPRRLEVGCDPEGQGRSQVRHLQRRRRRSRRLHGPEPPGGEPPPGPRGDDHRRLRDRLAARATSTSGTNTRSRSRTSPWRSRRPGKRGSSGRTSSGSGFSFDVKINRGGGAFVCGESSALFASLEGRAGEPRAKYIHATDKGLYDKPTNLNNVETWANVPFIIEQGRRLVRLDRDRGEQGDEDLLPGRQDQQHRPRRGPHGNDAPGDRLRHRRRDPRREEVQGDPDGRTVGRLHPRAVSRHARRFRRTDEDRLDDGLRRHDRHGRGQLHGRRGQVLHELPGQRILRQVRSLPRGGPADAGHPGRTSPRAGARKGTWSSSRRWPRPSSTAPSAPWGTAPRTPSSARSAISATSTRRTSRRSAVRPGCARP